MRLLFFCHLLSRMEGQGSDSPIISEGFFFFLQIFISKIITIFAPKIMTQDERWQVQYDQMMAFMEEKHRRPSKHRLEEHGILNWYKHTKKMIARGDYSADRIAKFNILQDTAGKYSRLNQYV